MKVALLTVGTRGDVQPFVALALELARRGHEVTLAAPTDARDLVEGFGLSYAPLRADALDLARSDEGRAAIAGNPLAIAKLLRDVVLPGMRALLDDGRAAARGADALVFHPKALSGRHLAEALGVPAWVVATAPLLVPTRAFPAPATVTRDLGPLNRATYALAGLAEAPLARVLGAWRRDLGLPARPVRNLRAAGTRVLPVLHAHSRHLRPAPPDWDAGAAVTGFWTVPADRLPALDPALDAFLEDGDPPVVLGFGSMGVRDPGETARTAAAALRALGRRGVLLGLPHPGGDDLFAAPGAPHAHLFPRAAATVHHGGAGTTAASLLAGVPTVLAPHGLDQPFWAARVEEVGAGASFPFRRLDAGRLRAALERALASDVRARASAIGALMRAEGGVEDAADRIEGGALGA